MDRPVAFITGGARRVGRAIALHLAANGYDVAFTYKTGKEQAGALGEELRKLNARPLPIQADLVDLPGAAVDIAEALSTFSPRLDAIINNASTYEADEPGDPDQPMRMWKLHVEAPLVLARLLHRPLTQSAGCIINMVDILAQRPMPGYSAYCASKAALWNLTLCLARELAPAARCCGIAPGVIEWPEQMPPDEQQKYLQRVPLRRSGTPEDAAKLIHFLLTGGSYITGQIIPLDGGRSIA